MRSNRLKDTCRQQAYIEHSNKKSEKATYKDKDLIAYNPLGMNRKISRNVVSLDMEIYYL